MVKKTSAKKKLKSPQKPSLKVAIVMGSESDLPTMQEAAKALKLFHISSKFHILSAHRTPVEVTTFAQSARKKGYPLIIAGAGGAAHLPGLIASHTEIPVIGVPVAIGPLEGQDALLSIVQMPKGIPVATVAIGNAWNAGLLAAQILGILDAKILNMLADYKEDMRKTVIAKSSKALKPFNQS